MIRIRSWLVVFVGWLFLFYNIERIHEPINVASFVYVLTATIAVATVAVRRLRNASLGWLLGGSLVALLVLKYWLGYSILGGALPLTVTEACAIALTVFLAQRVSTCIEQFEKGAADMTVMWLGRQPTSFDSLQKDIYREVRRARRFERPLTVITIRPTHDSIEVASSRLIEQVQRDSIKRLVDGRFMELLVRETGDCGTVAHRQDHFVLVLPELSGDAAKDVVRSIQTKAAEEMGLRLTIGAASFPDEEVTLSGLLSKAQEVMASSGSHAEDNGPNSEAPEVPVPICATTS